MTGPTWGSARSAEQLEQRVSVEADGTVVIRSGKVEYGQGIRTGFAAIVAEELDVSMDQMRVVLGETDQVPWDMGTFGSMSTAVDGQQVRAAASYARTVLLERAAARWGVAVAQIDTKNGCVVGPGGRSISYQELTAGAPLTGVVPQGPPNSRSRATMVDSPRRLEARGIVTGSIQYPADVRLPGMLRGYALHGASPGARLVGLDDRDAREMPGVVAVVRDQDFVGVVARRDEQALAAARALDARWDSEPPKAAGLTDVLLRRDADVEFAFARASLKLVATYHVPHIAHGSIGPSAAVADVRDGGTDLYVATQRPFAMRDAVAKLLGQSVERVRIHPQAMSGLYGRGNSGDAAIDAARLSAAVRRPVLVQWTREDEFRLSPHRPELDAELQAAVDSSGAIVGWRSEIRTNPHTYGDGPGSDTMVAMTSGRNAVPPYRLGRADVLLHVAPGRVRTGAFRSLAAAPNVFASESFIDELARASHQDPMAFRLRHVEDARLRAVLEIVRERSEWDSRARIDGRGLGVACAVYHGTYVAEVAEVVVAAGGGVRLTRVWCAVDAGRLVLPDGARNQIEGSVQQSASWTLLEELGVRAGEVTTTTWREYPIATCLDAPQSIDVVFCGDASTPSSGIGEPGSVPIAAAIANAVCDACGARVRRLPLTAAAVDRARKEPA